MHRPLILALQILIFSVPMLSGGAASAEIQTLAGLRADGYFRTRFLGFHNLDLNNGGYSGVNGPLLEQYHNRGLDTAADLASSFSSRLRVGLDIDLGDGFEIISTIDVLDNHLFGGVGAYPGDQGLAALYDEPGDPQRGWLRVKELHGVARPFKNVEIKAGRMAWSWGTGMLHNDGMGLDADYGSSVDGLGGLVRFLEYEVGFFWDFAYEGPISGTRYDLSGQPTSLTTMDDVQQWRLHVTSSKPSVEWGVLSVFRAQDLASGQARWQAFGEDFCRVSGSDDLGLNWNCYALTPRDYFVWSPDLYVIWRGLEDFRLEAEVAMVYGSITHARNSSVNDVSADILSAGATLNARLDLDALHVGLDAAIATGGDDFPLAYGVGYDPEGIEAETYNDWATIHDQSAFFFSRDRHLDLILFREVIGTFTNGFLVALPVSYDLFSMHGHSLRAGLRPIFSMKASDWKPLGVEADGWIAYGLGDDLELRFEGGYLLPLEGLDNPYTHESASGAFTTQLKAWWRF